MGVVIYFGDNKTPGRELHSTRGNVALRYLYNALHTEQRELIPPIFLFTSSGKNMDVLFRGLLVPGGDDISQNDDLVAVRKISKGQRFQNYHAKFTVLDVQQVPRAWLDDLINGNGSSVHAPRAWKRWVSSGRINALRAAPSIEIRDKAEQLPASRNDRLMLQMIRSRFAGNAFGFEQCAADLVRIALHHVTTIDVTRASQDGGRDAVGRYQIGTGAASVMVDFSIEAKCYATESSVGVRELSRLISRLRHRQFGVLVTTSWVHRQAYREIKEDGHPIIIMSGVDIVRILKSHGIATEDQLAAWLDGSGSGASGQY